MPVFNDRERILACLGALARQTYPSDRLEIIVVDNGSSDGTPDVVRHLGTARLLVHPGGGSYAARNAGLAAAGGELLAFTDADCLPDERWIEMGVRAFGSDSSIGLVGGRIEIFPLDPHSPTFIEAYDMVVGLPQEAFVTRHEEAFAATANAFTTRRVMELLGPFRDDLWTGGDVDLGIRVVKAGLRVAYAPDALVRHPARRTLRDAVRQLRRNRESNFRMGHGASWARIIFGWGYTLSRHVHAILRRSDLPWLTRARAFCAALEMVFIQYWIELLLRTLGRPFIRSRSLKGF